MSGGGRRELAVLTVDDVEHRRVLRVEAARVDALDDGLLLAVETHAAVASTSLLVVERAAVGVAQHGIGVCDLGELLRVAAGLVRVELEGHLLVGSLDLERGGASPYF